MEKKLSVYIENRQNFVKVSQAESLLEALLQAGISIDHSCGGYGTCGTCLVRISEDSAKPAAMEFVEQDFAKDRNFKDHERLACQIKLVPGLKIEICHPSES